MATPGIRLRKRIAVLFLGAIVFMAILIARVAWLQFVRGEHLRNLALDTRLRNVPVEARRGIIYDRVGRKLAISVNVDSVFAIPVEVKEPARVAAELSRILGMEYSETYERITKRAAFVWVKRKISEEQSQAIRQLSLPGIQLTQEAKRVYPNGNLASHVLGIAGIDSQGLEGLELVYDRELRGEPGKIVIEFDGRGREIAWAKHSYIPPRDGYSLVTTIDEVIQYIIEKHLEEALMKHQARAGTIIVMNPKTGEILALANRPDYDPNNYQAHPAANRRNFAVSDTYPPGSTFKPITAAAALEEGVATIHDRFYCSGHIEVPGKTIRCWKPQGHGSQSFAEIMENSCNVGFVNLGMRLGAEKFIDYVKAFGLAERTGIDLPGEASGLILPAEKVKPIDLAVMSFGQTLTVTPIELITAMSAIANDGVLMRPYLAKEITDTSGNVVQRFGPTPVRQVISRETAADLKAIMERVVSDGTGKRAYLAGYNLAGKTGTAEKVIDGRLAEGKYIASFCGFGPADDPQVAVLVILDEPVGAYYGGVIAAPVFGGVMEDILTYLGIQPEIDPAVLAGKDATPVAVPDVINRSLTEAEAALRSAGLKMRVEGNGPRVVDQMPPGGARVWRGSTTLIVLGSITDDPRAPVKIPRLIGLTRREAAEALGTLGLRMSGEGSGIAVSQDPAPEVWVQPGSIVTVQFRETR
ncbi:MAG: stage V sporulation protein D [Bacillota bacterium]